MKRSFSFRVFKAIPAFLFMVLFAHNTAQAQLVVMTTTSGCPSSTNGTVEYWGIPGGLTYIFSAGCPANGWGFDITNGLKFAFNNVTTNEIDAYDWCNSNLARGKIVMTGTSSITYYRTNGTTITTALPIRVTIQFTTNGSTVAPIRRNGNIVFRDMNTAFQVNFVMEANASSLSIPQWNATTVAHTGYTPVINMFNDLATTTDGQVQSALAANYFKIGVYTPAVTAQIATSCTNCGGLAFGQRAGDSGGATYNYVNNTGATAYIGFDAATAFQFRFGGGNFNGGGAVNNYSGGTNYAANQPFTFDGCQSYTYTSGSGVSSTLSNLTTRQEIRFVNAASTWQNGYLYATVAAGATLTINYRILLNASQLGSVFNYGTGSGYQPLRPIFDGANQTQGSYFVSVYPKFFTSTPPVSYGNTVTWDGSVDNKWEDPCNWDCRIPTIDDPVVIPAAPANWPRIDPGILVGDCKNIDIQGSTERLSILGNTIGLNIAD